MKLKNFTMITEDKFTEIFCIANDYCKVFYAQMAKYSFYGKKKAQISPWKPQCHAPACPSCPPRNPQWHSGKHHGMPPHWHKQRVKGHRDRYIDSLISNRKLCHGKLERHQPLKFITLYFVAWTSSINSLLMRKASDLAPSHVLQAFHILSSKGRQTGHSVAT